MKIFLSSRISNPKELLTQQTLIQELKKIGVSVITTMDVQKGSFEPQGIVSLDALVIDGSSQDADAGYLLAIALANKKPVLYLSPKGDPLDPSVEALAKNVDIKKYIKIVYYSTDSLVKKVKSFLQYLDENVGKESFTIKYTLRVSPRLDRYATWKAGKCKKNKADFLRDWLSDMLEKDDEYRKRLE